MTINRFPSIGKQTQGRDYNFYEVLDVNWTTYGGNSTNGVQPDMIITFSTRGVLFLNEGTGVIEYSFNGNTTHGELDSTLSSKGIIFDNRVVSLIWFRVKTGSTGPIKVRVDAWAHP